MTRFKRQSKSATRSANFVSRDPTGARLAMTPSRWTLHSSRFSMPGITGSAEWMPNRVGLRLLRALPWGVFGPGRFFFCGGAAGPFDGTGRRCSAGAAPGWLPAPVGGLRRFAELRDINGFQRLAFLRLLWRYGDLLIGGRLLGSGFLLFTLLRCDHSLALLAHGVAPGIPGQVLRSDGERRQAAPQFVWIPGFLVRPLQQEAPHPRRLAIGEPAVQRRQVLRVLDERPGLPADIRSYVRPLDP